MRCGAIGLIVYRCSSIPSNLAVFLAVVLCVYPLLRTRIQNAWLLCASYTFYGLWDWRFLTLIAFSTSVDYFIAQRMQMVDIRRGLELKTSTTNPWKIEDRELNPEAELSKAASDANASRKHLLYVSLACNLGLLGVFKYFNFFVDSFVTLGAFIGLEPGHPGLAPAATGWHLLLHVPVNGLLH